jgi:type IV secretion system protein VirB4
MDFLKKKEIFEKDRQANHLCNLRGHVTPEICLTDNDGFVSVIKLKGTSYDTKTGSQLNAYKKKISNNIRSINDPRFALWGCMLRRKKEIVWRPNVTNEYSMFLAEEYKKNIGNIALENHYYLAVCCKVIPQNVATSLIKKKDVAIFSQLITEYIPEFEDKVRLIMSNLTEYSPTLLGVNEEKRTSQIGSFYSDLLYAKPQRVPIRRADLSKLIYNRRLMFGSETVEIRHQSETTYAAVLSLKEYQETTTPDMTLALNGLPFEFNFVQSFCVIHRNSAKDAIKKQRNILNSAGDDAISQVRNLDIALDDLTAGRIVFGEHNASLCVFADQSKNLAGYVASAMSALEETDAGVVREDIGLEGQYIAQLPMASTFRTRPSPISSVNFASYFPMFNEATGEQFGHHWGQALLPLLTVNNSVYWLTTHDQDVGSALILGQTGSGKTVLMDMMLGMLQKKHIRTVFFDKDKGAKLTILALGGKYHDIEVGKPTGFNPFSLHLSTENLVFLTNLIGIMAGGLDASEKIEITEAVKSIYENLEQRSLSSLRTFLDEGPNSLILRLEDWLTGGRYGWVFDNEIDNFSFTEINGIDITDFLDNDEIRTPMMAYLFHRIKPLINGEPIAIFLDEFSKALGDPYFADWVDNELKVIRKKNGILVAATQSPAHALKSKIACSIMEQTPTKILLANEYANKAEYVEGLKLTDAEWEVFSTITKESRLFLVKHGGEGGESAQCTMPLHQSPDVLTILSGTTANVKLVDAMADDRGKLPSNWIKQLTERVM